MRQAEEGYMVSQKSKWEVFKAIFLRIYKGFVIE